jgi:hypothetical protein
VVRTCLAILGASAALVGCGGPQGLDQSAIDTKLTAPRVRLVGDVGPKSRVVTIRTIGDGCSDRKFTQVAVESSDDQVVLRPSLKVHIPQGNGGCLTVGIIIEKRVDLGEPLGDRKLMQPSKDGLQPITHKR